MPLVTVKCREEWFATTTAGLVYELAEALPLLLTRNGHELLLDEGTPPEAVQVDFQVFDRLSINIPDVWILIHFTEDVTNIVNSRLVEVKDQIVWRIQHWLRQRRIDKFIQDRGEAVPAIALDVF